MLTVRGRKSLQQLAATVPGTRTASQSLHQFINSSPWDWIPVRRALAQRMAGALTLRAWTVSLATIPKRGDHSVGVHRRFVPDLGRTINCQVGMGLFLSSGSCSAPVDWQLLLNGEWSRDPARRRRTRVPEDLTHQPVSEQLLGLVDHASALPVGRPLPFVMDVTGLGSAAELAAGLSHRGVDFLIRIPPGQPVVPHSPAAPRTPLPAEAACPPRRGNSALYGGTSGMPDPPGAWLPSASATRPAPYGTTSVALPRAAGSAPSAMSSALVRLPTAAALAAGAFPVGGHVYRLWTRRSATDPGRVCHWITNRADAPAHDVLALLPHAAAARTAIGEMEDDFGLQDFEGRSYPGWHHHMTMVSTAYAYSRLTRLAAATGAPPRARPVSPAQGARAPGRVPALRPKASLATST
nr:transposase [Streptomyces sp. HNM0574]